MYASNAPDWSASSLARCSGTSVGIDMLSIIGGVQSAEPGGVDGSIDQAGIIEAIGQAVVGIVCLGLDLGVHLFQCDD